MKKFKWAMQRVLDVKQKQEDIKKAELAKINHEIEKTANEIDRQKQILKDLFAGISGQSDRIVAQEMAVRHSRCNDIIIKSLKDQVIKLNDLRVEKTRELVEFQQYRKMLEKLREKEKAAFQSDQEKLEQKELDEQITTIFGRSIQNSL